MNTIYLGLGSNMGDRAENLRQALELLVQNVEISQKSSVWETEAYGVDGEQSRYFNIVVEGTTSLSPEGLLVLAKAIERTLGREEGTHNKPRPIDVDVLMYGEEIHETPELTIPHPRMHERAFVLAPFAEIAYSATHPKLNTAIADLEDALGNYLDICWPREDIQL